MSKLVRWCALLTLLLAEALLLTIRFDSRTLDELEGIWGKILGNLPLVLQVGFPVVAAVLLLRGKPILAALRQQNAAPRGAILWLAVHLLVFGLFAALTAQLFEGAHDSSLALLSWFTMWLLAGILNLVSWGLVALPPRVWLDLARLAWPGLLLGSTVGVAAWFAGQCTEALWRPMGRWTLWLVDMQLRLIYPEVLCYENNFVVGTPTFTVEIAPACSGYEGMGLILVFTLIYVIWFQAQHRLPQVLFILPLGVVLMWLWNAVRIALLVALGTSVSQPVAVGGFHSLAGWIGFSAVFLGLVAFTRACPFFTHREASPVRRRVANPAAPYLVPFLAIVAIAMGTGALSDGFDWWYPARVLAGGGALLLYRHAYRGLGWSWSWSAVGLGLLTFLLWLALVPSDAAASEQTAQRLGAAPAALAVVWLAFRSLGHIVVAPLAEELLFRGYLTRRLQSEDFTRTPLGQFSWLSFGATSLAFGLLHGAHWLPGTLAGALFALALYHRRRIGDAVLAHATANALLAVYVLTTGAWSLW